MDLCPKVKNILLLDSEGRRMAAKYFTDEWPTNSAKEAWEKAVFAKTPNPNTDFEFLTAEDITMIGNNVVVCKFINDLHFYVIGGDTENELILATVLEGFFDAVGLLLRGVVEKSQALENVDLILLCIDEIVDRGIILETDANIIAEKVATPGLNSGALLSEQTISQGLKHLTRSFLK